MNRLTITNEILDEINFEVPSDKEGSYNILDIAKYSDEEEKENILLSIADRLAAYENTELEPEQIDELNKMLLNDQIRHGRALDKLLEYQKLEKQGLLIKLPCKVGNTIYVLDEKGNIRKCSVYNVTTNIYANTIKDNPYWIGFEIKDNLFGKTVFLTREEAEKALEEIK